MAELLVAVAIIAVLVAIAIPVFNSQLEKSRESTDLANVRAAYAQVMNAAITEDKQAQYEGNQIYNETTGVYSARVPLKQKKDDWESYPITIAEVTVTKAQPTNDRWTGCPGAGGSCTVSYSATGGVVFDWSGGTASGTPPSLQGAGITLSLYNGLKNLFVTQGKYTSMSSWDSQYGTSHIGIGAINAALEGKGIVSCSIVNSLYGDSGDVFGKSTHSGAVTEGEFAEAEKSLYYLWTTDTRASKGNKTDELVPVMVARTNAQGLKEYAVIESPVLRGNGEYYNALSSYKDENSSIVRPHDASYDINKLIGDVQFSTNYEAVMQIYQSKNPVTTK